MLRLHRSLLRAIRLIPKVLVITFGDVALISSPDLRLLGLIIVPVIAKEKGKVQHQQAKSGPVLAHVSPTQLVPHADPAVRNEVLFFPSSPPPAAATAARIELEHLLLLDPPPQPARVPHRALSGDQGRLRRSGARLAYPPTLRPSVALTSVVDSSSPLLFEEGNCLVLDRPLLLKIE
ncbi:hypothetical protein PVAP13_2KG291167 [Panicum virgatum]|uniref:Uncharacterized protein n=1 Tax=Panicum virgatum TaxID=38727 RepID=A0A8T0W6B8_PANVG|nr:hypothetical protein PVAP13_2KG291167 [Panicum virgatum]